MSIEWQTQFMFNGDVATFHFNDTVQGYLVGNSGFAAGYGDHDHWVRKFGVKLEPSKTSLNTIQVTASIIIQDDSGNTGAPDACWAFVTVVAWTGPSSEAAYLNRALSLCNDTKTLTNVPRNVIGASAALNSFEMSYEDSDHHVVQVSASVNAQASGQKIEVYGSDAMRDSSGHVADCNNLSAGVLASLVPDPGFEIRLAGVSTGPTDFGRSNDKTSVSFSKPVKKATALLVSWEANYEGGDHNVLSILAGAMGFAKLPVPRPYFGPPDSVSIDDNKVTLTTNISMFDDSNHQTTTNQGSFLVIAAFDANS